MRTRRTQVPSSSANDSNPFCRLPVETFETILSFVCQLSSQKRRPTGSTKDLKNISVVCKAFTKSAQRFLLKNVNLSSKGSVDRLLKVIKGIPGGSSYVESITFSCFQTGTPSAAQILVAKVLKSSSAIKKIEFNLDGAWSQYVSVPLLLEAIYEYGPKKSFALSFILSRTSLDATVWEVLYRLQNLDTLEILEAPRESGWFGDYSWNQAPTFNLRSLSLDQSTFEPDFLNGLLSTLRRGLEDLTVSAFDSRYLISTLTEVAGHLTSLKALSLFQDRTLRDQEIKLEGDESAGVFLKLAELQCLSLDISLGRYSSFVNLICNLPPTLKYIFISHLSISESFGLSYDCSGHYLESTYSGKTLKRCIHATLYGYCPSATLAIDKALNELQTNAEGKLKDIHLPNLQAFGFYGSVAFNGSNGKFHLETFQTCQKILPQILWDFFERENVYFVELRKRFKAFEGANSKLA